MEQLIDQLLSELDSELVDKLPCVVEPGLTPNFRIGLDKGPQITFGIEIPETYFLTVKEEIGELYRYQILVGSDQFIKCRNIEQRISALYRDSVYTELVEDDIDNQSGIITKLIQPIIEEETNEEELI